VARSYKSMKKRSRINEFDN